MGITSNANLFCKKYWLEWNSFITLKKKSEFFVKRRQWQSLSLVTGHSSLKFGQNSLTVNWLFQEKTPSQKNHDGHPLSKYKIWLIKVGQNIIHNSELLVTNSKKSFKILLKTSDDILALRPMKVKGLFFRSNGE